jgi:hypothetical protein
MANTPLSFVPYQPRPPPTLHVKLVPHLSGVDTWHYQALSAFLRVSAYTRPMVGWELK